MSAAITLNGRNLRVYGTIERQQHPWGSTTATETLLSSVQVIDDDTGEDVTDEFEDFDEVTQAAWRAAKEAEYGDED